MRASLLVAICVNVRGKVLILNKSSDLKRSKVNVNVGHPRKFIQLVFSCRCLPFGDCSVRIERFKKWSTSTGSCATVPGGTERTVNSGN